MRAVKKSINSAEFHVDVVQLSKQEKTQIKDSEPFREMNNTYQEQEIIAR